MAVVQARVISLHWEEAATAAPEATLEVEHANGDRQLFVVQIKRMTDRIKGRDAANADIRRTCRARPLPVSGGRQT
jgi:hypothetical protein